MMQPILQFAVAVVAASLTLPASAEISAADRHFLDHVKPLLESRCVNCHGPEKEKSGLRLDSRAAVLEGGDSGPGVVPGKPAESVLLRAVMHADASLKMPPKEKLTNPEVAIIDRWIRDGAPWPQGPAPQSPAIVSSGEHVGNAWTDRRNPIVKIFNGQRLDLWSMKPIMAGKPPAVRRGEWTRNEIDAFVLNRLEQAKLEPSPEADRRSLIRRATLDLTGLLPTPGEVRQFVDDASSNAYGNLVDRLLASPHYGEHWARQWLDVVRYSDSNGFDWDEFRPQAWRFRDYVVRSLNADKPFDQFVREQLAGDELVDGAPATSAEQDCLIATGYLRLGPFDNSAPAFGEQARSRAELLADLTETTGSAFLGLTMSCCRCHDHKYDPLSQVDHYRLRAFFANVKFADETPIDQAAEQRAISAANATVDQKIKSLEAEQAALIGAARKRLTAARDDVAKGDAGHADRKTEIPEKDVLAALTPEEHKARELIKERILAAGRERKSFTHALLMSEEAGKAAATPLLVQGDYRREKQAIGAGFPSILDPNPARISKSRNPKTGGARLALADWIVSRDNPLTARVLVNRIWQGHLGRGIVATANDFGFAGARPTHLELLDYLADRLVREGWSLKRLHRLIVTSATYRQSSSNVHPSVSAASDAPAKMDPQNELLWRQNLRRMSAEQIRDSLLAVSGLLRERGNGGSPLWPDLPADVLQANPAFLDDNSEHTKGWYPSPPSERNVRGIYLIQKRGVRVPFLETFDLPENLMSCPRRNVSTVAPQALSLMNGSDAVSASRALAARVEREAGEDVAARVRRVFALAFQREPSVAELEPCLVFLKTRPLVELCRAVLNTNEFVYVD